MNTPWEQAEQVVAAHNSANITQMGWTARGNPIGEDKTIFSDRLVLRDENGVLLATLEICYVNLPFYQSQIPTAHHHRERCNGEILGLYTSDKTSDDLFALPIPTGAPTPTYDHGMQKYYDDKAADTQRTFLNHWSLPMVGSVMVKVGERKNGYATILYRAAIKIYGGLKSGSPNAKAQGVWAALRRDTSYTYTTTTSSYQRVDPTLVVDPERFKSAHTADGYPDRGVNHGAPDRNDDDNMWAETVEV